MEQLLCRADVGEQHVFLQLALLGRRRDRLTAGSGINADNLKVGPRAVGVLPPVPHALHDAARHRVPDCQSVLLGHVLGKHHLVDVVRRDMPSLCQLERG